MYCSPARRPGRKPWCPADCSSAWARGPPANTVVFTQGSFTETDNPLDLVIQGKGFFQIQMPDGTTAYTRAGNFQMDKNGNVVTANGNPLEPQITIPAAGAIDHHRLRRHRQLHPARPDRVANRRTDSARQLHQSRRTEQPGQRTFFTDRRERRPDRGQSRRAEGIGTLQQGYLESSNVSVVEEFINMISSQRAYEANTKVVKAADEMYQQVNNITQ